MSILDRIFRRRPVTVNTGGNGGTVKVAPHPVEADLQALQARLAELDSSIPELRLLRQDVADARADVRRLAGEMEDLRQKQQSASAVLLSLDQLRREVREWQKKHERWNQHTLDSVYECERAIREIKGEAGAEEEDDSKWEGNEA